MVRVELWDLPALVVEADGEVAAYSYHTNSSCWDGCEPVFSVAVVCSEIEAWPLSVRSARQSPPRRMLALLAGFIAVVMPSATWAQDDLPQWVVGRPELVIGLDFGEEEFLFESVVTARFLPDDRIVVADAGPATLRLFDSSGEFLRSLGGRGGGPGEFNSIYGFWVTSSGLLSVWDPRSRRVTSFRADGELMSTFRPEESGRGNLEVFFGALSDNSIMLGSLVGPISNERALRPDPWLVVRFDSVGNHLGLSKSVRGMWRWSGSVVPFSPLPWTAFVGDTMFVADGFEPVVEVRDRGGTTVRSFAVPRMPPLSDSDWQALSETLERGTREVQASTLFRRQISEGFFPTDLRSPSVAGMLADSEGLLWIKEYDPLTDVLWFRVRAMQPAPGGRWNVYEPTTGQPVATIEMPSNLIPMDVTRDRVLGLAIDSLGVQRIVVLPLTRSSGQTG